ncbi:MAG: phage holin family protein [Dysgonamonadaceae bacterium]|jgi:Zn-dependent protease with chaperone function|nr:phage holin family protein [Dysgonamonadaceae bacterium]
MEKNFNTLFADIKKDLTAYITLKLEVLKLDVYEKSSVFSSLLLYGLILLLVVFFAFLFLFLALGLYLGQLLDSFGTGMVLVAVLYVIAFVVLLWQRKKIQNWLINLFVQQIIQTEDNEHKSE